MSVHAFVDESKSRGLLLAVGMLAPRELAAARRSMTALCLPGQYRLHFTKERRSRRGQILDAICAIELQVDLYDTSAIRDERAARPAALRAAVATLAEDGCRRLVLEQDDSIVESDRAVLFAAVRAADLADRLSYEHLPPRSEPLLWIPDAVAWCWAAGGHWRDRVRPVVRNVSVL